MNKLKILIFLITIILILIVIAFIFPEDGIKITENFSLHFPTYKKFFNNNKNIYTINTDSLIQNVDTLILIDTFDLEKIKKEITQIEFPANDSNCLSNIIEKLKNISTNGMVRIMHYGDSQIEGDRITANFRNHLQTQFGGNGIGLCLPVSPYTQWSIKQEWSNNWNKYTGYGYIDSEIPHKKYGPMITLCRFSPIIKDSIWQKPEKTYSAWLHYYKSDIGFSNTANFKKIVIYYGNSHAKTKITLKNYENILVCDSLESGEEVFIYSYSAANYLDDIKIEFEGNDSPDVYGISLEDNYGVIVDNIGLRGSSGDVFANQNTMMLLHSYLFLSPDLFILQFGGNVLVNVVDNQSIKNFANYFKAHLLFLKNINPKASFIVIGPSDMSLKIKDEYQSYPLIEDFIKELKKVTFESGAAYWDLYKAMGGYNSMISWVNANPPLAAEDYIHFTPLGASIVANKFYKAFFFEIKK